MLSSYGWSAAVDLALCIRLLAVMLRLPMSYDFKGEPRSTLSWLLCSKLTSLTPVGLHIYFSLPNREAPILLPFVPVRFDGESLRTNSLACTFSDSYWSSCFLILPMVGFIKRGRFRSMERLAFALLCSKASSLVW